MATNQFIPPFPSEVDRDAFGHYLSGFVDGEGSFILRLKSRVGSQVRSPYACFTIGLRADDAPILRQLQSFWQCGRIDFRAPHPGHPAVRYIVDNWGDLLRVVVPHFERYPLRAKKARDLVIWRQAVLVAALTTRRSHLPRTGRRGFRPKWQPDERATFEGLIATLAAGRQFSSPNS